MSLTLPTSKIPAVSENPKYLIFYFKDTDKLKKDIELLNSSKY